MIALTSSVWAWALSSWQSKESSHGFLDGDPRGKLSEVVDRSLAFDLKRKKNRLLRVRAPPNP